MRHLLKVLVKIYENAFRFLSPSINDFFKISQAHNRAVIDNDILFIFWQFVFNADPLHHSFLKFDCISCAFFILSQRISIFLAFSGVTFNSRMIICVVTCPCSISSLRHLHQSGTTVWPKIDGTRYIGASSIISIPCNSFQNSPKHTPCPQLPANF